MNKKLRTGRKVRQKLGIKKTAGRGVCNLKQK